MLKLTFLVNAAQASPLAHRAARFSESLCERFQCSVVFRGGGRLRSMLSMLAHLLEQRPDATYVVDLAVSGVAAASLYKIVTGRPLIVDTGDEIYSLAKAVGRRGGIGLCMTALLELWAWSVADHVVVRGHGHLEEIHGKAASEVSWLPDGVDVDRFERGPDAELRRRWAPKGELLVGLVGSLAWNHRLGICYGWDLIEAIHLLPGRPIRGILIGDGDGADRLKRRAIALGIQDRIEFVGGVGYDQLARYLSAIDVGLSTQTNDVVGRVRTTGKLPVYMAAGKFILATRVGEAARVLPDEMLIDYEGAYDATYPDRLAARLDDLLEDRDLLKAGRSLPSVALEQYDYRSLIPRLEMLLLHSGTRNR